VKEKRAQAVILRGEGYSSRDIAKKLNISCHAAYNAIT